MKKKIFLLVVLISTSCEQSKPYNSEYDETIKIIQQNNQQYIACRKKLEEDPVFSPIRVHCPIENISKASLAQLSDESLSSKNDYNLMEN